MKVSFGQLATARTYVGLGALFGKLLVRVIALEEMLPSRVLRVKAGWASTSYGMQRVPRSSYQQVKFHMA
jgi:hypothetical protein